MAPARGRYELRLLHHVPGRDLEVLLGPVRNSVCEALLVDLPVVVVVSCQRPDAMDKMARHYHAAFLVNRSP